MGPHEKRSVPAKQVLWSSWFICSCTLVDQTKQLLSYSTLELTAQEHAGIPVIAWQGASNALVGCVDAVQEMYMVASILLKIVV